MLGAIIGDIAGSRFEWDRIKHKNFTFFTPDCTVTDDSIMTLAIAKAILESDGSIENAGPYAIRYMQEIGRHYPECGFGGMFRSWINSDHPMPYNSFGNGAAMRVSPCGFAARSLEEAKMLARAVTGVTHNHPEGLKGAEATAAAIYLAKAGHSREEIKGVIHRDYYLMDFTLDKIRPGYQFNETCQETVPQALMAFFESVCFEDAIRNAVSLGGDSDTLAAITGGVAEAFYGIPDGMARQAEAYLDERLIQSLAAFEKRFPGKRI